MNANAVKRSNPHATICKIETKKEIGANETKGSFFTCFTKKTRKLVINRRIKVKSSP